MSRAEKVKVFLAAKMGDRALSSLCQQAGRELDTVTSAGSALPLPLVASNVINR